jgi:hypothetical protein
MQTFLRIWFIFWAISFLRVIFKETKDLIRLYKRQVAINELVEKMEIRIDELKTKCVLQHHRISKHIDTHEWIEKKIDTHTFQIKAIEEKLWKKPASKEKII